MRLRHSLRSCGQSRFGVGPHRATSWCLRLCCGFLTIASGFGIISRHWRWSHLRLVSDEHPRNSSTLSDEFIVPLLVYSFPMNSRAGALVMTNENSIHHSLRITCHSTFTTCADRQECCFLFQIQQFDASNVFLCVAEQAFSHQFEFCTSTLQVVHSNPAVS